ncbi:CU044_2847 family protein [Streptomyces sp. NPDC056462]|uniref:CU044_2847 family protein n=1 Tax=Streptomyces sp. NPDC056462 TaxID=3345826 RepID=UPI00368BE52F
MAYVGEMLLDGGQVVLLEVADNGTAGVQRVSRGGAVAGAAETLQQALGRVRPALGAVLDGTRALPRPPESVTVEFGITLSAEAGVVVARGSTEAHFAVSMQWTNPDESAVPGQRDGERRI